MSTITLLDLFGEPGRLVLDKPINRVQKLSSILGASFCISVRNCDLLAGRDFPQSLDDHVHSVKYRECIWPAGMIYQRMVDVDRRAEIAVGTFFVANSKLVILDQCDKLKQLPGASYDSGDRPFPVSIEFHQENTKIFLKLSVITRLNFVELCIIN